MLQKWFTPIIVALIAGLSVWLISVQPKDTSPAVSRISNVPDLFMENFTTNVLDANGHTQYELVAAHMAHYPHDDHSDLQTPLITVFRADGEQWTISSETGLAERGTDKITLQGEVLMQQHALEKGITNIQIETRELIILPQESYAETDQYTLVTQGNNRLEATGLQADFKENRMQLLSEVRGIYETRP